MSLCVKTGIVGTGSRDAEVGVVDDEGSGSTGNGDPSAAVGGSISRLDRSRLDEGEGTGGSQ